MRYTSPFFLAIFSIVTFLTLGSERAISADRPFAKIGHIVVIITENRSFDQLYGLFPAAEGLATGPFTQA